MGFAVVFFELSVLRSASTLDGAWPSLVKEVAGGVLFWFCLFWFFGNRFVLFGAPYQLEQFPLWPRRNPRQAVQLQKSTKGRGGWSFLLLWGLVHPGRSCSIVSFRSLLASDGLSVPESHRVQAGIDLVKIGKIPSRKGLGLRSL